MSDLRQGTILIHLGRGHFERELLGGLLCRIELVLDRTVLVHHSLVVFTDAPVEDAVVQTSLYLAELCRLQLQFVHIVELVVVLAVIAAVRLTLTLSLLRIAAFKLQNSLAALVLKQLPGAARVLELKLRAEDALVLQEGMHAQGFLQLQTSESHRFPQALVVFRAAKAAKGELEELGRAELDVCKDFDSVSEFRLLALVSRRVHPYRLL